MHFDERVVTGEKPHKHMPVAYNRPMKTLSERIEEFMVRKGLDRQAAIDALIVYALDAMDARRKGGNKTGNRPQQEKHLARARKVRSK